MLIAFFVFRIGFIKYSNINNFNIFRLDSNTRARYRPKDHLSQACNLQGSEIDVIEKEKVGRGKDVINHDGGR